MLNALVLFGLTYYIYRRYFKYRIEEKIAQKEGLLKGLEEQGYFLEGRSQFLHQQLERQEKKAEGLRSKIDQWHAAVDLARQRHHDDLLRLARHAGQRVAIKDEMIVHERWRALVMPEALEQTRSQLQKKFSHDALNKAFVAEVLEKIEMGKV